MFNKKLVGVLCFTIAVLLAAKVVLVLVMFVWSFFGAPPVQIFDARIEGVVKYLLLLQELGSTFFIYAVTAAVNSMAGAVSLKGRKK